MKTTAKLNSASAARKESLVLVKALGALSALSITITAAMCLPGEVVRAATISDDFSSCPGSAGNGWKNGWTTTLAPNTTLNSTVTGTILWTTIDVPASGNGRQGTISRQFDSTLVDVSQPLTYSFSFTTPNVVSGTAKYVIFNSANDVPRTGTDENFTWAIVGTRNDGWTFADGNGSGGVATYVSWGLGQWLQANQTYDFIVTVDPVSKTWSVSVTYQHHSGGTIVKTDLNFRNQVTSDGTQLHFGAATLNTTEAASYEFGISNLSITGTSVIPEVSAVALYSGAFGLLAVLVYRRKCV